MSVSPDDIRHALDQFDDVELAMLEARVAWKRTARVKQLPPDQWPADFMFRGVAGPRDWRVWGIRSGRGFGKTRSAAEWIWPEAVNDPGSYNFVIAPTFSDVQHTCFEGDSGLLRCIPDELILEYNKTNTIAIVWTGEEPSQLRGFAADSPERLRGPNSHRVWADEVASWSYPDQTWSNMQFGLRLGRGPRICWTGTLKPKAFIRHLVEDKSPMTFVVQGSTDDNVDNLAPEFYDNVAKYRGTALGRQELEGELLNPEEAGIVRRSQFQIWSITKKLPQFDYIVYSLDTAFTEHNFDRKEMKADPSACSVWGLFSLEERDTVTQCVMLLDAWDEHLGFPALIKKVTAEKGYHYGASSRMDGYGTLLQPQRALPGSGRKPDIIIIEDKGSGISLRQALASSQILTHPYNPKRADKLTRLHAVTPMFAHGRVWVPESEVNRGNPKSWADPLITQVCSYVGPGSTDHDDYVDCTSQAMRYIMDNLRMDFSPKKIKSYTDRERDEKLKDVKQRSNPYG